MTGTPPGWYPDAQGVRRWFDGERWTEHTQDTPAQPSAAPEAAGWPTPPPSTGTAPQYGGYQSYAGYPAQQPAQQPGQPYGAQPPTGGSGGNGGKAAIIGGVLALVVVAVVLGVILIVGSGGDDEATDTSSTTSPTTTSSSSASEDPTTPESSDPTTPETSESPTDEPTDEPAPPGKNTPEAVAVGFTKAILDGDCDAATKYVAPEFAAGATGCADTEIPSMPTLDGLEVTAGKADVTGDTAHVPVDLTFTIEGLDPGAVPPTTFDVTVTRTDGTWRVSNFELG